MRLIDIEPFENMADATVCQIQVYRSGDGYADVMNFKTCNIPTVDVEPVRHGRWEWLGPNELARGCMCGTCSACKVRSKYIVNTDICPNCGADMRGNGNG